MLSGQSLSGLLLPYSSSSVIFLTLVSENGGPSFAHLATYTQASHLRAINGHLFGVGVYQELNIPTIIDRMSERLIFLANAADPRVSEHHFARYYTKSGYQYCTGQRGSYVHSRGSHWPRHASQHQMLLARIRGRCSCTSRPTSGSTNWILRWVRRCKIYSTCRHRPTFPTTEHMHLWEPWYLPICFFRTGAALGGFDARHILQEDTTTRRFYGRREGSIHVLPLD